MPKISVIMGVYNCGETLCEALNSIINQTISDWEVIMCDDGSCDNTYVIAESYVKAYPEKFTLLKNTTNLGLNATLNKCLKVAKGEYIARMDGDDVCEKSRFEHEINFLDENPQYAIVSTDMIHFDDSGEWGYSKKQEYPEAHDLVKSTPFCHAPCMVRREAMEQVGGYTEDSKLMRVEDYHLWMKMYKVGFRGKNIHLPLYSMRDDREAYNRRKFVYRINEARVKYFVIKEFGLSIVNYIHVLKPILVGLLPEGLYKVLHRRKLKEI